MSGISNDHSSLDPQESPYHPFHDTKRYGAYRKGWEAQCTGTPVTAVPYALSQVEKALAWLDGWSAARERDAEPVPERRRVGAGAEGSTF